ncbi:hypothetical protein NLI96_g10549 [Meripilus lineatus]|uniref:Uncharacterized protein n=1 Tax=Meripilus lineatus TaxID=2056292 RepID=A0AAD5UVT4_9APHY|nr:hypothetical protein NLI96_g10549 [Physisporinus lineatus]
MDPLASSLLSIVEVGISAYSLNKPSALRRKGDKYLDGTISTMKDVLEHRDFISPQELEDLQRELEKYASPLLSSADFVPVCRHEPLLTSLEETQETIANQPRSPLYLYPLYKQSKQYKDEAKALNERVQV